MEDFLNYVFYFEIIVDFTCSCKNITKRSCAPFSPQFPVFKFSSLCFSLFKKKKTTVRENTIKDSHSKQIYPSFWRAFLQIVTDVSYLFLDPTAHCLAFWSTCLASANMVVNKIFAYEWAFMQ